MKRRLPQHVSAFVDRHGKERFRWRKTGFKAVYLKAHPGTEKRPSEEVLALNAGAAPIQPGSERILPGTISDLLARFYRSPLFTNAGERTQYVSRNIYEAFRTEFGDDRVDGFRFDHIEAILAAKTRKKTVTLANGRKREVGGATAAHILRKKLLRLFALAVKLGWISTNPVAIAERVKVPKGGWHTWTDEEIAQYQARHPLGTKARMAMEIALWTGQRRGDVHLFGPRHMKGGRIKYTQEKGGKELWLPAAPQMLEAIEAMPAVGLKTFIVTEYGNPFTKDGFGNWFRDRCDEAGLPQCAIHGLRKALGAPGRGATSTQFQALKLSTLRFFAAFAP
jgi:integrase